MIPRVILSLNSNAVTEVFSIPKRFAFFIQSGENKTHGAVEVVNVIYGMYHWRMSEVEHSWRIFKSDPRTMFFEELPGLKHLLVVKGSKKISPILMELLVLLYVSLYGYMSFAGIPKYGFLFSRRRLLCNWWRGGVGDSPFMGPFFDAWWTPCYLICDIEKGALWVLQLSGSLSSFLFSSISDGFCKSVFIPY